MSNFVTIQAEHVVGTNESLETVVNTDHIISIKSFSVDGNSHSLLSMMEIDAPIRLTITATKFKYLYLE